MSYSSHFRSGLRETDDSGPLSLLSDSEFRLFRDLIYEECGISLSLEKRAFLESRLKRRLDELGITSGCQLTLERSMINSTQSCGVRDSMDTSSLGNTFLPIRV